MAIRTLKDWLKAMVADHDVSDLTLQAVLLNNGVDSDTLYASSTERQRDLCLADMYYGAAISSVKSGTQGESDGGWTHYVAIKNIANRDALMRMAKALYDKWGEAYVDSTPKIRLKPLY